MKQNSVLIFVVECCRKLIEENNCLVLSLHHEVKPTAKEMKLWVELFMLKCLRLPYAIYLHVDNVCHEIKRSVLTSILILRRRR